jgi:sugar/nucleoside kinase (ribokinase family)
MIALAAFGARTALAGKIGTDELGRIYNDRLSAHGVSSNLKTHDGPTGTSIIMVTPDSERTMNTHLGTCQHFTKEDVDYAAIEKARFFHFTGYMWDTDPQKEAVLAGIEKAKAQGTTVVFDVADPFAAERNQEKFVELIRDHVDIVFANAREAELLLDISDPKEAAQELGKHVRYAIVKAGADGSYVTEPGEPIRHIPAAPAENIVDTTGAGDVYAAGFLFGLVRGCTAADSGAFAAYVASKIIQQVGAQFDEDSSAEIRNAFAAESYKDAVYSRTEST